MKKACTIIIVFIVLLCFSACKEDKCKEYTYLPQTELHTYENASGFHREFKITYKYDEKGNVIKKTENTKGFFGIFNVRERQYDIEYTYNENGDISQELTHSEDFCTSITDGHQIYDEGYNYIYNEKQQLIKKEIINPSDYEDALCGYEYEYDEFGNCIKEYKFYANGTKELEFENLYDRQNKLIKKQYMTSSNNFMSVWDETNYTYDMGGKLSYTKTVHYERSGEISHYYETNYYYDELNRLIKVEETGFDNDGKTDNNKVIEYKDFIEKEN